jgi:peptide/nickel transport system substrate-binding protein
MNADFHGEIGYLPYEQLQKVSESPNIRVITEPSTRLFYAHFNNQMPPTNDIHFRKACCYAFDYDSWIHNVQHDMVEPVNGPIPGHMWGSLDPKERVYKYDLDLAKKELAMANPDWKKYQPIWQMPFLGYPMTQEAALLLQNGLNQIGVESKVEPKTFPQAVALNVNVKTSRLSLGPGRVATTLIPKTGLELSTRRPGEPFSVLAGTRIPRWMNF